MERLFFDIAVIAGVSAVFAWLAVIARQPVIVAYVLCGVILGPWGMKTVEDTEIIHSISQIGVVLLLFMAGVVLHPQRLLQLMKKTVILVLCSCFTGWVLSLAILTLFGFGFTESAIGAAALMFSSTILVTKLIPTITLHQKHMGSVAIAVLIAQDIIAVLLILLVVGPNELQGTQQLLLLLGKAVILLAAVFIGEQFALRPMMIKAERYSEVIILMSLGWCLVVSELAKYLGLTHEIGAFIAGVALARNKLSLYVSEKLKPLRDFFLVLFFFVLGTQLDLLIAKDIWLPALVLALFILVLRPCYYRLFMGMMKEGKSFSWEIGFRMGQASEFGLIMCTVAVVNQKLNPSIAQLLQLSIIITMIISSYIIVMRFPTPIATSNELQRD